MRVDGVTFVDDAIRKIPKEQFIENHMCLWPEMRDADRRKKLSDIHDRICGKSREDRKK